MPTIIDYSIGSLGEVKYSRLTLSEFQNIYGQGWVLYEGQSIVGTPLATLLSISTLEDARALFPRAGNNGRSDGFANPDGDQVAGTNNQDRFASHGHSYGTYGNSPGVTGNIASSADILRSSGSTNATGGSETSSKSIILNAFIRVA